MNAALETLCYIQEQTSFEDDYLNKFGYEMHDMGNRFYLTFPAVLQTFNDGENRNGRHYDQQNIWNCIQNDDYIQTMLKQNSWMGEIDHPTADFKDEEFTVQRIANPDMKKTSHYIRSPKMIGNNLEANIQTDSSNQYGMNMAIKIVDGKIIPCFSVRLLGTKRPGDTLIWARKVVTYDWILYGGHPGAKAKITQPIMESVQEVEQYTGGKIIYLPELARRVADKADEVKLLCEAFQLTDEDIVGLTESGNSVVVADGTNTYVQPISSEIIRKKTKSALTDWLKK